MRVKISKNKKNETSSDSIEDSSKPFSIVKFNVSKYRKNAVFSVGLLIITVIVAYFMIWYLSRAKFIPFDIAYTLEGSVKGLEYKLKVPDVMQVRDQENPVNGVLVTRDEIREMSDRKLVVISLNNHIMARPQFGLSRADLVLEVLAEGGITRYNAFYYQDQEVEKVGPIRSARSYMLEFFLGFDDPVFVHEGQASYLSYEKQVEEANTLKHLWQWGVNSMQTAESRYRDEERIYSSGYVHSLMTGFELINNEVEQLGWVEKSNIDPLKFKFDASEEDLGEGGIVDVAFTSFVTSQFNAKFEYDKNSNSYLRSVGGQEDIDALDNQRIAPKVVIVEYHDYRDTNDEHSRILLDMIGEDEAFIFQDGKMIKGKWKKLARTDRTKYYDDKGGEIEFNRGQIWVVNAAKTSYGRLSVVTYNGEKL